MEVMAAMAVGTCGYESEPDLAGTARMKVSICGGSALSL
jgi:hypothetical protein